MVSCYDIGFLYRPKKMGDLSRMWFRLKGSGSSSEDPNANNNTQSNLNAVGGKQNDDASSTFEKFRRASFRRKSTTPSPSSGKRSSSPKFLSKQQKSYSLDECDEMEEKQTTPQSFTGDKLNVTLSEKSGHLGSVPLSDVKSKNSSKKSSLRAVKNSEAGKKKFYKNFCNSSNQKLAPACEELTEEKNMPKASLGSVMIFPPNSTALPVSLLAEDDNDDVDDDTESDDDVEHCNMPCLIMEDNLPPAGKEKILLTDRKFRNNRIEKSSSKTKIGDLEKKESIKRSRSSRRVYQPPTVLVDDNKGSKKCLRESKESKKAPRSQGNLNFQALVKFVVNNKKFLSSDDFKLIRRRSISEAASAVIQVAATRKPLPIALKYCNHDSVVAKSPKINDYKGERNVVLLKNQPLDNSLAEQSPNNNNSKYNNENNATTKLDCLNKPPVKGRKSSSSISHGSISSSQSGESNRSSDTTNLKKVKRNSSNSSKSSGNFEDEAFYSCDELEEQRLHDEHDQQPGGSNTMSQFKRKPPSPSLTSRVAAKINETTTNYKNRKAANKNNRKRKNLTAVDCDSIAGTKPEIFRQLSVGEQSYERKIHC